MPRVAFETDGRREWDFERLCPGRVHHRLNEKGRLSQDKSVNAPNALVFMGAQRGHSRVTERATVCGLRHDRRGL